MLILALVLSVFGGTVHHILSLQVAAAGKSAGERDFSAAPLRLANPTEQDLKEQEDELPSGPSWASFPRAF
ncbi:hypothetical protein [Azospirillum picis]|uniref:Uncharacterized protein n=1 Tax=Azospirillum picis TaxID=488438 RepID=A0ABU0MHI6_9PROT|nr:hypothetical protein [Azospirillum picis]MBP2298841.1 hypothetical protein [Azospirillum picis]MDQ0532917.1 hypothetical protein [Azospirillum picis]